MFALSLSLTYVSSSLRVFHFSSTFLLIKRVLVASGNKKIFKMSEESFMSLISSRGTVLDLIYFLVALHILRTYLLKGCCLYLQLACSLVNQIQSNLWQFPLYMCHSSGVSIAIFWGQQYQMLLRNPKIHYNYSSLYQAHLQFLCINQIPVKWLFCFFGSQTGVCR